MKSRFYLTAMFMACLGGAARAADVTDDKANAKEAAKATPDENAKKPPASPSPAASTVAAPETTAKPAAPAPKDTSPKAADPKRDAVVVLPKVEVKNGKITDLDRELQRIDKEIAAEKKNTRATETDKALNDSKVSGALAVFGGVSSKQRESLAEDRLSLLEAEREIVESIAQAKTPAEKQDLQNQLEDFKAMSRDLERMSK